MMIKDLSLTEELDSESMAGVRGGFFRLPVIPVAKEKVDDDQSLHQFEIQVATSDLS